MIRFFLFLGLCLHIAVAIWNGFFGPSLGAEGDALAFHNEAVYFANNLGSFEYITGWVYAYFLGAMYKFFGIHIFFGSMISVFAWLLSAIYLIKALNLLDQSKKTIAMVIFVFSIWPSAVLNTSVTLRESFQTLSVILILYGAIGTFKEGKKQWAILLLGMALGSVLHGALLLFSGAMFFYLVYSFTKIRLSFSTWGSMLITLVVGSAGGALAYTLLGNIAYSVDQGLVAAVQSFNEGATSVSARANYRDNVYFSGPLDFIIFIPVAFFQYMMEPLPTRIASAADAVLFLENLLRAVLLLTATVTNFRLEQRFRGSHSFVLISYLILCLIWAVGTVNWGTASRHHAPGLGLLLIVAFYSVPVVRTGLIGHGQARSNPPNRKRPLNV